MHGGLHPMASAAGDDPVHGADVGEVTAVGDRDVLDQPAVGGTGKDALLLARRTLEVFHHLIELKQTDRKLLFGGAARVADREGELKAAFGMKWGRILPTAVWCRSMKAMMRLVVPQLGQVRGSVS